MRTFIERLDRERTEALTTIDGVLERAGSEDRDTTDAENAMLTEARTNLERIERERSSWADLAEQRTRGDAVTERINNALVRSGTPQLVVPQGVMPVRETATDLWPDAGHYVADFVTRSRGNEQAAQRLDRAVANQLLADNPGIVPKPIIGPVINFVSNLRPLIASVMNRPMPGSGATFSRPRVTQHTQVGEQTTEKTEVASRKMVVSGTDVSKHTFGGTLDISFQNRDWTEPAILQLCIDDLAAQYAISTDAAFATAFVAAVTQTQKVGTSANWTGAELVAALAAASATIFANTSGRMPDTIWCAPDVWAKIAALSDTTGRPLFVALSPTNAVGSVDFGSMNGSVAGLRLIADPNLPATTAIVGVSSLAEFYEQVGGQLSVTEPTILGFVIAYYGYAAWIVVAPQAFVKLIPGP